MFNEVSTETNTHDVLPLPARNEAGVYQVEETPLGKQLHTLLGELNDIRIKLYSNAEADKNLNEFAQKSTETAVIIGKALGIMSNISDRTLAKEADFLFHPEYKNADVLVNAYGNIALSIAPGFGKEDDGSFTVDIGLVKQGGRTAVKIMSGLRVEKNGIISFIPRRSSSGGNLDKVVTIEEGRVITDISATPKEGVFAASICEYETPSKQTSPIPHSFKQEASIVGIPESDDKYNYTGITGAKGKQINFCEVMKFMRSPGFNGNKEISDHKQIISQLLESRLEK